MSNFYAGEGTDNIEFIFSEITIATGEKITHCIKIYGEKRVAATAEKGGGGARVLDGDGGGEGGGGRRKRIRKQRGRRRRKKKRIRNGVNIIQIVFHPNSATFA
uniref:Uncharacterized protein n=1 Tax=Ananas comosus var. bracteatus TaxID=296719 RepID=A0A6V7PHJ4_ANACO|nr:unnamed protein product [Ananas comosus var. bracteatus]